MPNSFNDPLAEQCAQRETGEIAAEDQTRHDWPEVLDRHTQGDEGTEESVGELDEARRDDQRTELRPHRPGFPCSIARADPEGSYRVEVLLANATPALHATLRHAGRDRRAPGRRAERPPRRRRGATGGTGPDPRALVNFALSRAHIPL